MSAISLFVASLIFLSQILTTEISFAQTIPTPSPSIDWGATCAAWEADPKMQEYYEKYCKASLKSLPSGGGLSPSKQMQFQMFQSFLQPFFNALGDSIRQSMFGPSSPVRHDLRQEQEEMRRKQEEEAKRSAYEQWINELKKAEFERIAEEQRRKKEGAEILARARIGNEGLKREPIGGSLEPFSWSKPDAKVSPQPVIQYPAPKSAVEQVMCAAYFSELASDAANRGDIENARFYGDQMSNVMQGLPTSIKCSPPKELTSKVDLNEAKKENRKLTELSRLYQEAVIKIEKLSDLQIKLNEVKVKKEDVEQKIKELDKQIEEIKARSRPQDSPERKAKEDDLLAQALALKGEAERQYQEAVQTEEELLKKKLEIEKELNGIKDKIKTGGQ